MGNLTENFSLHEFTCKCGCGKNGVSMRLVVDLQTLRDRFNKPIKVTSGVRCEKHNRNVGGSPRSQHLLGHAADIRINGVDPRDIARAAALIPVFQNGGIGVYRWGCHLDVGKFEDGRPARWCQKGFGWKQKRK